MSLFLVTRVLHVLLATIWFGAVAVNVFFLVPAVEDAKAAGGQVMGGMIRRGYITFLTAISGIVTLTGFYLYYHLTQGFDPIASASMPARVFGVGAVAGLIASVVGPMFVARRVKRVAAIMAKAGSMPEGAEKSALVLEADALRVKSKLWAKITLALMTIALVTMSIGHYVG
jgi:uncharacterized membrane protein